MDRITLIRRTRLGLAIAAICLAVCFLASTAALMFNSGELRDGTGVQLRERLGDFWPSDAAPSALSSCYFSSDYGIDSHSTYISCIVSPDTMQRWQAHLRADNFSTARALDAKSDRFSEIRESKSPGVRRNSVTGQVPSWWKPADQPFDAYEAMIWYDDSPSGVGRGNYIQYDPDSSRIWMYCYACQHDLLWERGQGVPIALGVEAAEKKP